VVTVVTVVFKHAQMLDIAGPADAFALVQRFDPRLLYEVCCVSADGGPVLLSNGLSIETRALKRVRLDSIDTLVVAGAEREGLFAAIGNERLGAWVRKAAGHARRLVSVCVGAFALAHWGLLGGRRATSHGSGVDLMQRRFPKVQVDRTSLYVEDGSIWTAGGVTTGIDMSLAMIEADSSRLVAGQVAAAWVMSYRRIDNQSQHSAQLQAQTGRYAGLVNWRLGHLRQRLDIATLAAQAGESERSFCRRFSAEVGEPPGQFVETLRIDAARRALEGARPPRLRRSKEDLHRLQCCRVSSSDAWTCPPSRIADSTRLLSPSLKRSQRRNRSTATSGFITSCRQARSPCAPSRAAPRA
jgi:transcriptional regulator GlxA family with amidase domain